MTYHYQTKGTCSRRITLELEGEIIRSVAFDGGCGGNLIGISRLVEGMAADDVISMFSGTPCGYRNTSCPDQLAIALGEALRQETGQALPEEAKADATGE
ncbi:MAG: TIGR03905 family TSCPD domain-containing protein [Oscillospiraceae bacterium]|jgi:uncharacterized protein (TIGR03905 family)|nr:TIGR03905 family TSCPD domain-containing protein [Oscillospiraceae bacterium]